MNFLMVMLTVLFVGLKLTGYIAWSWLWVFAPIWIPIAIAAVVGFVVALVMAVLQSRR